MPVLIMRFVQRRDYAEESSVLKNTTNEPQINRHDHSILTNGSSNTYHGNCEDISGISALHKYI
jgi:hypothetical protein